MHEYKPNERIVDRAVEIWKRLLASPKYDNLGGTSSPEERRTMAMASALAQAIPSNATPERLVKFGAELKKRLMSPKEQTGGIRRASYYEQSMSVDYGPCSVLNAAAEASDLKMEWPWKTNMWLYGDRLSVSAGYGAESVYHYPLSGDRWLVARLSGSDMEKVIALASGKEAAFDIETPQDVKPDGS